MSFLTVRAVVIVTLTLAWMTDAVFNKHNAATVDSRVLVQFPSQAVRRELLSSKTHPETLPINLVFKGQTVRLNLRRSTSVQPNDIHITYSDDDPATQHMQRQADQLNDVSLYEDVSQKAVISAQFQSGSISLTGMFENDGKAYHLVPTKTALKFRRKLLRTTGGFAHTMFPVQLPMHAGKRTRRAADPAATPKGKRGAAPEYHIQIVFLVDHTVYDTYMDMFNHDVTKVKQTIRQHYALLFSSSRMIFMVQPGFPISLYLKEIHVFTTAPDDIPYNGTTDATVKFDTLAIVANKWRVSEGYYWNNPDHISYFTRYKIENAMTLGVAYLGGVCVPNVAVSALRDFGGVQTWPVFTHELAHNMGAYHDGNNGCDATGGYLMAPVSGPVDEDKEARHILFSNCTIEDMSRFLAGDESWRRDDNGNMNNIALFPRTCMMDKACDGDDLPSVNGAVMSLAEQCRLATGYYYSDPDICSGNTNVCLNLFCSDENDACTHAFAATPNTPCGENKVCFMSQCIEMPSKRDNEQDENDENKCQDNRLKVPNGCVNKEAAAADVHVVDCEQIALNMPAEYFKNQQYYMQHCPATMKKYGLYTDDVPCRSYGNQDHDHDHDQGNDNSSYSGSGGDSGSGGYNAGDNDDTQYNYTDGFNGQWYYGYYYYDDYYRYKQSEDHHKDAHHSASSANAVDTLGSIKENKKSSDCGNGFFRCDEATCIDRTLLCDGKSDCDGGGDELGCNRKALVDQRQEERLSDCGGSEAFQCGVAACIDTSLVCDGERNCDDGSDERNCGREQHEDKKTSLRNSDLYKLLKKLMEA